MKSRTTTNERIFKATPHAIYEAFTHAASLEQFMAPGDMTAKVHAFSLGEGGGYEMSLYYPASSEGIGKTAGKEDRFHSTFLELVPDQLIRTATTFETADNAFKGEMHMTITIIPIDDLSTMVKIRFDNIPEGIHPEDNEKGTALTLLKLDKWLAGER
ncbi:SRPBCC domain-containing protein [Chitinophaga sp. Cy-1792]|uniref:SRPBCC domain-containing protein n=1 Tax=Chitinophaga sp. Cy-1792 TaxID=2608339 RepID=UPI0014218C4C|nr:SRPBCC domain-containing protein [Chitinophaga sp. Cy-1792]NIG52049.1 ATPase [Chitinophaga sp. Cy-1792]